MKTDDKLGIYTRYISSHFGKIHGNRQDFEIQRIYYQKNYLKLLPQNHDAKILDIGCGMGHFLNFLMSESYTNYLGVDMSEENIAFCRGKNFNVIQANAFSFLESSSDKYDVVVMNDIIEHLEKQEILKILRLILSKLNTGGRLIIKAPNASNPIMASSSRYYDFTHELLFTEESLDQVLYISGFRMISILPQDLYVFYYNPLTYPAKLLNFLLTGAFRFLFYFYGRKATKIFTKNLLAVAVKEG